MPVNEQVVDSLTIDNVKVSAAGPVHWQLAGQKATADHQVQQSGHFARLQLIAESEVVNSMSFGRAVTGMLVKQLLEVDPLEAMSSAVVGQQGAKVAQSTPPETGRPTSGTPAGAGV